MNSVLSRRKMLLILSARDCLGAVTVLVGRRHASVGEAEAEVSDATVNEAATEEVTLESTAEVLTDVVWTAAGDVETTATEVALVVKTAGVVLTAAVVVFTMTAGGVVFMTGGAATVFGGGFVGGGTFGGGGFFAPKPKKRLPTLGASRSRISGSGAASAEEAKVARRREVTGKNMMNAETSLLVN